MFALVEAAGWPIWFLIVTSVIALAIIGERWWSLREGIVMPRNLLARTIEDYRENRTSPQMLSRLARSSPLGQVFAAGLRNAKSPPAIVKEAIEESGRTVAIDLERFLTSLGTIAAIAPLLGLFGTVIGMIEIFGAQTPTGTNPLQLAHGISIALYNTAFGILVAVPAMIFYRYFRAKVDVMLVDLEMQAIKLVEVIHGERQ
ncbi:MAG TPA: MotA/TolQ/ExbB proton channel family protein [Burkholderiales bacterium]